MYNLPINNNISIENKLCISIHTLVDIKQYK